MAECWMLNADASSHKLLLPISPFHTLSLSRISWLRSYTTCYWYTINRIPAYKWPPLRLCFTVTLRNFSAFSTPFPPTTIPLPPLLIPSLLPLILHIQIIGIADAGIPRISQLFPVTIITNFTFFVGGFSIWWLFSLMYCAETNYGLIFQSREFFVGGDMWLLAFVAANEPLMRCLPCLMVLEIISFNSFWVMLGMVR